LTPNTSLSVQFSNAIWGPNEASNPLWHQLSVKLTGLQTLIPQLDRQLASDLQHNLRQWSSPLHVVPAGERAEGTTWVGNPGTNNLGAKLPHQPVTGLSWLSQIDHESTPRASYGQHQTKNTERRTPSFCVLGLVLAVGTVWTS